MRRRWQLSGAAAEACSRNVADFEGCAASWVVGSVLATYTYARGVDGRLSAGIPLDAATKLHVV